MTGLKTAAWRIQSAMLLLLVFAWPDPALAQPDLASPQARPPAPLTERMHALCTRVVSGDRIDVEVRSGNTLKIDYLGVQLPSPDDPNPALRVISRKALALNRELVENKPIALEFESTEPDEAGRMAAYVFVGKTFVNAELIRQGYARVADASPECQLKDFLQKQETKAFQEGLGIWAVPSQGVAQPKAPEVSPPPRQQPAPAGGYVASQSSKVFHKPDCSWAKKIAAHNRVILKSREEALATDRRPCKICVP